MNSKFLVEGIICFLHYFRFTEIFGVFNRYFLCDDSNLHYPFNLIAITENVTIYVNDTVFYCVATLAPVALVRNFKDFLLLFVVLTNRGRQRNRNSNYIPRNTIRSEFLTTQEHQSFFSELEEINRVQPLFRQWRVGLRTAAFHDLLSSARVPSTP